MVGLATTRLPARADTRAVAAVAALAGVLAAMGGARPTGLAGLDVFLVIAAVALAVAAAARAPWWVPAVACMVAVACTFALLPAAIAAAAAVGSFAAAGRHAEGPVLNAVGAGMAFVALSWSRLAVVLGLSAVVALTVGVIMVVFGALAVSNRPHRLLGAVLGAVVAFVTLALLGVGLSGYGARADARAAVDDARSAVDLLSDGDYAGAQERFDSAAVGFASVNGSLDSIWAAPSKLIPVVSQNVRAASSLAAVAETTLAQTATALGAIDPADLRVENGKVDLDAVRAAEEPLRQVQSALQDLDGTIADVRSPWLLGRLDVELDQLSIELADQGPRLDVAIDAVRLAPQLLGSESPRRYLVLFTTPAEARGLGGFIGNYAEIVIDDGRIEPGVSGRRSDLEDRLAEADFRCDACSAEFLAQYGRFGMTTGPGGTAAGRTWSNLTMGASFPDVAVAAAAMYPTSGGTSVDGVFVLDPYAIEAIMEYGGPVEVPGLGVTVEPAGAADYILSGQYEFATEAENDNRIDALDVLAAGVFDRLLSGTLPEPAQLAEDFAPLISERRVLGWTRDADEQAMFAEVGLLGTLPELGTNGGFSVSMTNAGGSKIDVFLERDVTVETVTADDGSRRLVATVTLTNSAPDAGLPDYVIGNLVGLPKGTSKLYVTFYGPATVGPITLNGEVVPVQAGREAGWSTFSLYVTISSGETVQFGLDFALAPAAATPGLGSDAAPGAPALFEQPLATRTP